MKIEMTETDIADIRGQINSLQNKLIELRDTLDFYIDKNVSVAEKAPEGCGGYFVETDYNYHCGQKIKEGRLFCKDCEKEKKNTNSAGSVKNK